MPLFGRKRKDYASFYDGNGEVAAAAAADGDHPTNGNATNGASTRPTPQSGQHPSTTTTDAPPPSYQSAIQRPKLIFHCQLAHGSPTGIISNFTNVKELYVKIAECYDMSSSDILFCTLNTHKADMEKLLGGQIGLDDFIFVHRKGQKKEIELEKSEEALGLTITDNGAGLAFIKRIKEGSIVNKVDYINVGDHIEKIDGTSLVGCRHFEVAKMLKDIPKGATFTIRLIEPLKAGFSNIGPRSGGGSNRKSASYGSGKETLRLRSKGPATVQNAPNHVVQTAVDRINGLLESFMGINDSELATQIWEFGQDKDNPHEFVKSIDNSELEAFGFTDDFIFDLWGAINDAKCGRLKPDETAVMSF